MAMTKTETTTRYDYDIPGAVEDILGVAFEVTTVMFTTVHRTEDQDLDSRIAFWGYRLKKDGTRASNAMFQAVLLDPATRARMEFGFLHELGLTV